MKLEELQNKILKIFKKGENFVIINIPINKIKQISEDGNILKLQVDAEMWNEYLNRKREEDNKK